MKRIYIVVEGAADASALRRILPNEVKKQCDFVIGRGKSAAISDARTLLTISREPVALVVDADDADPTRVREQQKILKQLLESAASGIPCRAFLAVPNLDSIMANRGAVNQMPLVKEIVDFVKSISSQ